MGKKSIRPPATKPPAPAQPTNAPPRTSVADALFTTTQQRVLALLFGQPGRSFFTKELIDLAEGGSGAVQRELTRLHRSGLVTQTRVGNQKHYQANAKAPVFTELHGIVSKILGPAEILREALMPVADDLLLALLYGSVAGQRDTALSDIDVLLVSDALTLEQVYELLAPAEKQLGRLVSPTLYTDAEFRHRLAQRNPFLVKLFAGMHVTLLGDKDDFIAAG